MRFLESKKGRALGLWVHVLWVLGFALAFVNVPFAALVLLLYIVLLSRSVDRDMSEDGHWTPQYSRGCFVLIGVPAGLVVGPILGMFLFELTYTGAPGGIGRMEHGFLGFWLGLIIGPILGGFSGLWLYKRSRKIQLITVVIFLVLVVVFGLWTSGILSRAPVI